MSEISDTVNYGAILKRVYGHSDKKKRDNSYSYDKLRQLFNNITGTKSRSKRKELIKD